MKSIRYAALAAVAGLVLTGCGDEPDSNSGSNPTTSAPTSSSTTTGGLPLTVTRTGGFAGFDDRVVLGADGIASVSKRGKDPVRCRLDAGLLTTITDAVKQIDWTDVGTTKPTVRYPDDMIIAVAASGGLTRLEDPKVKPLVTPVSQLLTEATVPPGKLCKAV
ncbi:hypothetical protein [Kribbella caucasensis]|uniref:hypothetical protein n=1 Tax=Kribbella caucasensis TaxID=2512215 RepID=UPI001EDD7675|nr:hypothetical protein [Kribbella sp. VKM Ac-2527]